jgi:hypothetical protein
MEKKPPAQRLLERFYLAAQLPCASSAIAATSSSPETRAPIIGMKLGRNKPMAPNFSRCDFLVLLLLEGRDGKPRAGVVEDGRRG